MKSYTKIRQMQELNKITEKRFIQESRKKVDLINEGWWDKLKKHKPTQKEVASITREVLVKLYKTLWTRKGFWSNGLENI